MVEAQHHPGVVRQPGDVLGELVGALVLRLSGDLAGLVAAEGAEVLDSDQLGVVRVVAGDDGDVSVAGPRRPSSKQSPSSRTYTAARSPASTVVGLSPVIAVSITIHAPAPSATSPLAAATTSRPSIRPCNTAAAVPSSHLGRDVMRICSSDRRSS
jgi:hypothetical protein